MSDLISRSELYMNDLIRRKDVLALFPTNDCSDKMVGLYERVLDIPTAYDVEKVVAELNEATIKIAQKYLDMVDGKETQSIATYNEFVLTLLNRIMKQIRKGGVE